MEANIFCEEVSEMIPFDYSENILYFPVRHHSPGCSFHLLKVLERYKPDCILVEGPQTADKLIPVLTDSETIPPVAFYYFYRDTARYVSDTCEDYKCYYPFLRVSPEYNALRYAKENGIKCGFIDMPYGDILINTAAGKGLRKRKEISSYSDEYYLSESQYFQSLCEKTGMRSFEEFWERYFETDALKISTEEYIRRLHTYCSITRMNTPYEDMLQDGCLVRESFMADNIRKMAQLYNRVLVVTGGFHSSGLYNLISGKIKPQKYKLHSFSEKVQDVYAMSYSFEAADALSGYSSGMQNPGFYDRMWGMLSAENSGENAYETAVMDTLLTCAKSCIQEKLLITMSDVSSAVSMYRGLAAIRGKQSPGLYELYDCVGSCFIKGERNGSGELPLKLLSKIATGSEIGRLCSTADVVPIVKNFEELCQKYKLKIDGVTEQKIDLEIFAKPVHKEISRLFYRMGFLDSGFSRRIKGADLINNNDRSRIREQWSYKRSVSVDAALIDSSAYGGTIEEACTVLSLRRLREVQKCSEASKLFVECFLMGLNTTEGFADKMEDIIISDGDFFSVGQGVYYFNMLHSLYELYRSENHNADHFLRKCFYKACSMLPDMIHVNEEKADECIRICRLLYSLVTGTLICDEFEMLKDVFISMINMNDPEPSVYGAVLGLLYGMDSSTFKPEIRIAVQAYLSGSKEIQKKGAVFLRGLFSTARDIVLVSDEFIRITDNLISGFEWNEFLEVLPELKLAFSYFSPYETDRIAESAASLHNSNTDKLKNTMNIDSELFASGSELEKEILKEAGWSHGRDET